MNREALGWAGATVGEEQPRIWNEDWEVRINGDMHVLKALSDKGAIDLTLVSAKPVVAHGVEGISPKGSVRGNASHYYSFTRLETSGSLMVDGEVFEVTGTSWMDHEFGTSFLEPAQRGWDWFSIQLEDGRELMLFDLRRSDGSIDIHSSGTLIQPDGTTVQLKSPDFVLSGSEPWRSEESGAIYPVSWQIEIPRLGLSLTARAAMSDQEFRAIDSTGVIYWEGSIVVEGIATGQPLRGRGYLEMTGYSRESMGELMK